MGCLTQGKDLYLIQLKEIQPPYPLIEFVSTTSSKKIPPAPTVPSSPKPMVPTIITP
ncbi:unnamed protein product, partial [Rotaria sp. Silwood1]